MEIIRAARNPDSQEVLLKIAAPTHEWFFSEMYQSADFIAYQEVAEEHSWWLPDDHEEIARNLFESFVPVELDWIQFEAEDNGGADSSLDQLEGLASHFEVSISESALQRTRESMEELPNPDHLPDHEYGGSMTIPGDGPDIAAMFEILLDDEQQL